VAEILGVLDEHNFSVGAYSWRLKFRKEGVYSISSAYGFLKNSFLGEGAMCLTYLMSSLYSKKTPLLVIPRDIVSLFSGFFFL